MYIRTSESHPLYIAELVTRPSWGRIGVTLCPGKRQVAGLTGAWKRDLGLDLDVIESWNAAAVLTLVESHELTRLEVPRLGEEIIGRHIDWYHLPIRDGGAPEAEFEAAWQDVGERLRGRIRAGFNVLVHCMGGLGRAGTIASRLLVELGSDPSHAVEEVRRERPGAIETAVQLEFVGGCTTVPERQPDESEPAIRDRALGALVGLAVGDALGTTLEFAARDGRPRLNDMEGGGPFGLMPGQWTDDTSMAIALADSLIQCGGLDEHDLMSKFVSWWKTGTYSSNGVCFDIGTTVLGALRRFEKTGDPISGSTDPLSAGNGSLMRLSPVAIRYWNDRRSLHEAAVRQSLTTHGAPEAVDACALFSGVLADAIAGRARSQVLAPRSGVWSGAIGEIAAGSWRGKRRSEIKSTGYVAHSLEAALWCVGRTGSFAEAVLLAANLAGDADTVAAITGQLAGALYGVSAIPDHWVQQLSDRDRIDATASKLFAQSIPTT